MAGIDSNTKLCLHMNGTNGSPTFTDSSLTPKTVTAVNATISTAQSVFGGASGYFPGNGYLSVPDNEAWNFSGNFTIYFRFRLNSVASDQCFFSQFTGVGYSPYVLVFYASTGKISLLSSSTGSSWDIIAPGALVTSNTFSADTWYDLAVIRNGTNISIVVGGVNKGSVTRSAVPFNATSAFTIGANGTSVQYLNGYLDEFFISGVAIDPATLPTSEEYSATTTYTKTLTANVKASSSFIRRINKILRANAKVSSTAKKRTSKALRANTKVSSTVKKRVNKTLKTIVKVSASMARSTIFTKILTAGIKVSSSMSKRISKALTTTVLTASNVQKSITKTLTVSVKAASSAVKAITKMLTTGVNATVSAVAGLITVVIKNIYLRAELNINKFFTVRLNLNKYLMAKVNTYRYLKAEFNLNKYLRAEFKTSVWLKGRVDKTMENQDFEMYAGDTAILNFSVSMAGTLTGATIKWVMSTITKTIGSGITVTGDRTFTVTLSPADTTSLAGSYPHEAEITDSSGNVSTVARGTATIKEDFA